MFLFVFVSCVVCWALLQSTRVFNFLDSSSIIRQLVRVSKISIAWKSCTPWCSLTFFAGSVRSVSMASEMWKGPAGCEIVVSICEFLDLGCWIVWLQNDKVCWSLQISSTPVQTLTRSCLTLKALLLVLGFFRLPVNQQIFLWFPLWSQWVESVPSSILNQRASAFLISFRYPTVSCSTQFFSSSMYTRHKLVGFLWVILKCGWAALTLFFCLVKVFLLLVVKMFTICLFFSIIINQNTSTALYSFHNNTTNI